MDFFVLPYIVDHTVILDFLLMIRPVLGTLAHPANKIIRLLQQLYQLRFPKINNPSSPQNINRHNFVTHPPLSDVIFSTFVRTCSADALG